MYSNRIIFLISCFFISVPVGLEDVSKYPYLFAELINRGYSDDELIAIAGGNLLRVFHKVEAVSHPLYILSQVYDWLSLCHDIGEGFYEGNSS